VRWVKKRTGKTTKETIIFLVLTNDCMIRRKFNIEYISKGKARIKK